MKHEIVYCKSEEEWKFVWSKCELHKKYRASEQYGTDYNSVDLKYNGWTTLEKYKRDYTDLVILSFQEWCDRFNYVNPFATKTKELKNFNDEERLEYAKKHYTLGVKYHSLNANGYLYGEIGTVNQTIILNNGYIYAGFGFIYSKGNWAEIIKDEVKVDQDKVCDLCKDTFFDGSVNSGPHNLCEGCKCKEATELYLEEETEEIEIIEDVIPNLQSVTEEVKSKTIKYGDGFIVGEKVMYKGEIHTIEAFCQGSVLISGPIGKHSGKSDLWLNEYGEDICHTNNKKTDKYWTYVKSLSKLTTKDKIDELQNSLDEQSKSKKSIYNEGDYIVCNEEVGGWINKGEIAILGGKFWNSKNVNELGYLDAITVKNPGGNGCSRNVDFRHATEVEIEAYKNGIRNISDIKQISLSKEQYQQTIDHFEVKQESKKREPKIGDYVVVIQSEFVTKEVDKIVSKNTYNSNYYHLEKHKEVFSYKDNQFRFATDDEIHQEIQKGHISLSDYLKTTILIPSEAFDRVVWREISLLQPFGIYNEKGEVQLLQPKEDKRFNTSVNKIESVKIQLKQKNKTIKF